MNSTLKLCLLAALLFVSVSLFAQNVPPRAKAFETAADIPYNSVPNFLKLPQNLYLGEGIGVARNSKSHVFVYTRSGVRWLCPLCGFEHLRIVDAEGHSHVMRCRRSFPLLREPREPFGGV